MGIRRNNYLLAQSTKFIPKGLFHGKKKKKKKKKKKNLKYQSTEIIDSLQRQTMPVEMKEFVKAYESMSKSGNMSRGRDTTVEELNKERKTWMHRCVPTDEMWLSVCINKFVKGIGIACVKNIYNKEIHLDEGIEGQRVLSTRIGLLVTLFSSISGSRLHRRVLFSLLTETAKRKRSSSVQSDRTKIPQSVLF